MIEIGGGEFLEGNCLVRQPDVVLTDKRGGETRKGTRTELLCRVLLCVRLWATEGKLGGVGEREEEAASGSP